MSAITLRRSASFLLLASLLAAAAVAVAAESAPGNPRRDARTALRHPRPPLRRDESVTSTLGWADREETPRVLGLFQESNVEDSNDCGCGGGWMSHASCMHLRDDSNA